MVRFGYHLEGAIFRAVVAVDSQSDHLAQQGFGEFRVGESILARPALKPWSRAFT